ncbi:MAG: EamA family transporter [Synechococcaceae cyanobacterium SM2_3_2]|nr:EamA family transporter [Synechococcaceae cyanobacterium SM2_3_2]
MDRPTLMIMFTSVLGGVIGQLLLKAGALALGPIQAGNLWQKLWAMASQPMILSGFCIYGMAALGFIVVLSRAKLSVASPLIATSYVFTVLAGSVFFGEEVPLMRWVGVGLILLGVLLVLRA